MAEFTLLELHLDDASFTANAPLSGGDDVDGDEQPGTDFESLSSDDDGGRSVAPLLVAFAVLAVLAVVVKKLRGGDADTDVETDL